MVYDDVLWCKKDLVIRIDEAQTAFSMKWKIFVYNAINWEQGKQMVKSYACLPLQKCIERRIEALIFR